MVKFSNVLLCRATVALSSKMTPNMLADTSMVNTTVFKESEWIGANKEYRDVPTHSHASSPALTSLEPFWV
jgi:hypothetical protein